MLHDMPPTLARLREALTRLVEARDKRLDRRPGRCPCGCGACLLPAGTVVEWTVIGNRAKVGAWATQDHWNVPVNFLSGGHAIVQRTHIKELK